MAKIFGFVRLCNLGILRTSLLILYVLSLQKLIGLCDKGFVNASKFFIMKNLKLLKVSLEGCHRGQWFQGLSLLF